MARAGVEIIFLADRLIGARECRSLRGRLDRLRGIGYSTRVICRVAVPDHGLDDLVESPGLGRRWQRPWAARAFDREVGSPCPRILHVLGEGMIEAGLVLAERWGVPYVVTLCEFPGRGFRLRLSREWCRGIIATNRELAALLPREFGVPADWVRWIPNGIHEEIPSTSHTRPDRVPVIGAAGPLVAASGFATFLNAARKVIDAGFDAEFLIAGAGDGEAELRRRAERLRIADRLTFADEETFGLSFWDALDVYCQTSVAPTTGGWLVDAMARGIPSIATDAEGLRSLIEEGSTGLRIAAGDPAELAEAIARLLNDRPGARHLGETARRVVSPDFRPSVEVERLDQLYQDVMGAGRDPGEPGRPVGTHNAGPADNRAEVWTGSGCGEGPAAF